MTDSVIMAASGQVPRGEALRGRIALFDYRDSAYGGNMPPRARRYLTGACAAAFDPRPAPARVAMSAATQQAILLRALDDVGFRWLQNQVHIIPGDSTHDVTLLRAFLTRHYGNAIVVDTVATDFKGIFMKAHGRHHPVACEFANGHERCWDTRSFWERLWS